MENCNDLKSLSVFVEFLGENFCDVLKNRLKQQMEENWGYKMSLLKYKLFSVEDTLPYEILQHSFSFLNIKQRFIIANISKAFQKLALKSIKIDKKIVLFCNATKNNTPIKWKIRHANFESDCLNIVPFCSKLRAYLCYFKLKLFKWKYKAFMLSVQLSMWNRIAPNWNLKKLALCVVLSLNEYLHKPKKKLHSVNFFMYFLIFFHFKLTIDACSMFVCLAKVLSVIETNVLAIFVVVLMLFFD